MNTQIFENENETCCNNKLCHEVSPDIVVENVFGKRNLCDLERIRNLILTEEDKALEVQEVLTRILEHYNMYINYR
jgi:hypothetical protein